MSEAMRQNPNLSGSFNAGVPGYTGSMNYPGMNPGMNPGMYGGPPGMNQMNTSFSQGMYGGPPGMNPMMNNSGMYGGPPGTYGNMPSVPPGYGGAYPMNNPYSMPYQPGFYPGMQQNYPPPMGPANFSQMSQGQSVENYANIVSSQFQMDALEDMRMNAGERKDGNLHTKVLQEALKNNKTLDKGMSLRDQRKYNKNKTTIKKKGDYGTSVDIYVPRSEYFFSRDRHFLEEYIMKTLRTEGPVGRGIVTKLDKKSFFKDDTAYKIRELDDFDDKEEYFEQYIKDGIYLDYIKKLIFSYNIQKSEQRAMRENRLDHFTKNGNIRMDNDIFNDIVSKPEDISPNFNDAFNTYLSNSSFTGRNSEEKFKVFKMKVIIYKVILSFYKLFNKEETLSNELKILHRDFYYALNQMNIPYLDEKISVIKRKMEEYSQLMNPNEAEKKEMENMEIFLNEADQLLKDEKELINTKAHLLYNKWLELKHLRKEQGFQCTRTRLNVLTFNGNEYNPNVLDYAFILSTMDLPPDSKESLELEEKRRKELSNLKCHIIIYINEVKAFETKDVQLTYPFCEAEFNNLFYVDLYSRPVTMHCEVYINGDLAQRFEVDPPGVFAKTVTSSASLYEEIPFGPEGDKINEKQNEEKEDLNQEEDEPLLDKSDEEDKNEDEDDDVSENTKQKRKAEREKERKRKKKEKEKKEKAKKEEEKIKEEQHQKKLTVGDTKGRILLRAEYEGNAPDLPPTKIENKLELISIQKRFQELIRKYNKFDYPFDVNDPRNVAFIDEMKKGRLDLILKFKYKEYLLNFFDVESMRHYLLSKRNEKASLKKLTFPILEYEIETDERVQKIYKALKEEDEKEKMNNMDDDLNMNQKIEEVEKDRKIFETNEEFFNFLSLKVKHIKKDIVHHVTMKTYHEVINEAEMYDDPTIICKEFFARLFTKARKLAPISNKPPPVKLEKTSRIKVNIHVVKGYNVPVRFNTYQNNYIEHFKLESAGLRNALARDVIVGGDMNVSGISGAFNPAAMTNNQSFNLGMGMNQSFGSYGNNPNFSNMMYNPYNKGNYFSDEGVAVRDKIQYLSQFEKKVNSFIEIKVVYYKQEKTFRTDCVDGNHPDYNHHIEFEIKPDGDKETFSREELAKCPGVFYFTLYDQVRKDGVLGTDDEVRLQVFQNKYLGSFSIPFVTVFQNASLLDTLCKVEIPQTVFGYYSDTSDSFDVRKKFAGEKNVKGVKEEPPKNALALQQPGGTDYIPEIKKIVDPFSNTYVSLYITLDPVPNFTKNEDDDYVPGYEDSIFLINGTKWLKDLKNQPKFKDRNVRLFAENFDGFSVFMPRFLKEHGEKPPSLIFDLANRNSETKAIEAVARYVALIPFIEDSQTWSDTQEDLPDCWCTDKEFLNLGFGDYEEHAVLLCNYFNYVDEQQNTPCVSYLALGDAHPEGMTCYVVRISKKSNEVEFWNAKTGDCFYFDKTVEKNNFMCLTVTENFVYTKSQSDKICQLKSVGAIVTFDNVYVNVQAQDDPGLIYLDLDNSSHWMPFLNADAKHKYFQDEIESVQKDDIFYTEPIEMGAVQHMTDEITRYLREEIMKERQDRGKITNWEETSPESIKNILEKYDRFSMECTKSMISVNKDVKEAGELSEEQLRQIYDTKLKNIQLGKEEHIKELEELEKKIKGEFSSKKDIYGFPLNISFTSLEQIKNEVFLTGVHLAASNDDVLSLTVYVSPFPMNVNSVWIFLAILKD